MFPSSQSSFWLPVRQAQVASCYSTQPVRYGRVKMTAAPGANSPSCPLDKALNRSGERRAWLVAGERLILKDPESHKFFRLIWNSFSEFTLNYHNPFQKQTCIALCMGYYGMANFHPSPGRKPNAVNATDLVSRVWFCSENSNWCQMVSLDVI